MNNKAKGSRDARRVVSLAVMAAVTVLTAACSSLHAAGPTTTLRSEAASQANLAFAHCMQTHGVPNFPDPSAGQTFSVNLQTSANTVSGRATIACKHLLPSGSTSPNSGQSQTQLEEDLKIVQCLHTHGEPNVPDPTMVNGALNFALQPSEVESAQFQAALKACESLLPKGVHLK
jgi:hypothetical protein